VSEEALTRVEAQVGLPLPGELRTLYAQIDGGSFEPDVALYALEQAPDAAGVVEATRRGLSGLPGQGVWRFGLRGGGDHLFAARRSVMAQAADAAPAWIREVAADTWLFGRKNSDTGELELFKSLQALLWSLIPPVESEDFGENTLAKAMNAVTDALQALEEEPAPAGKPKKKKAKARTKAAKAKAKSPKKAKPKSKPKARPKKKAARKRR
jgi:hypothetical protein